MLPGPSLQASLIGPSGRPKDREPILAQALTHYLTDGGNGGEVQPGRATKRASLPSQRGVTTLGDCITAAVMTLVGES